MVYGETRQRIISIISDRRSGEFMKIIKKADYVWLFLESLIIVLTFFQMFMDNPFDVGLHEFQIIQYRILVGALFFWGANVVYTILIKIFFANLRKINITNHILCVVILFLRGMFFLIGIM